MSSRRCCSRTPLSLCASDRSGRGWAEELAAVRKRAASPEHINDGPETHPSARLERLPGYRKVRHGTAVAKRIGVGAYSRRVPSLCRVAHTARIAVCVGVADAGTYRVDGGGGPTLDWFRALGYHVVGGPDQTPGPHALRKSYADVMSTSAVRGALRRLNSDLPEEALDDALRKLTQPAGTTPGGAQPLLSPHARGRGSRGIPRRRRRHPRCPGPRHRLR